MMIQTFPILITSVYISMFFYFSLLSFHLPFSWFILFYAGLLQFFILSSSQNNIDIAVFSSLRTFAYLFTFSFYGIIFWHCLFPLFFFFFKLNSF